MGEIMKSYKSLEEFLQQNEGVLQKYKLFINSNPPIVNVSGFQLYEKFLTPEAFKPFASIKQSVEKFVEIQAKIASSLTISESDSLEATVKNLEEVFLSDDFRRLIITIMEFTNKAKIIELSVKNELSKVSTKDANGVIAKEDAGYLQQLEPNSVSQKTGRAATSSLWGHFENFSKGMMQYMMRVPMLLNSVSDEIQKKSGENNASLANKVRRISTATSELGKVLQNYTGVDLEEDVQNNNLPERKAGIHCKSNVEIKRELCIKLLLLREAYLNTPLAQNILVNNKKNTGMDSAFEVYDVAMEARKALIDKTYSLDRLCLFIKKKADMISGKTLIRNSRVADILLQLHSLYKIDEQPYIRKVNKGTAFEEIPNLVINLEKSQRYEQSVYANILVNLKNIIKDYFAKHPGYENGLLGKSKKENLIIKAFDDIVKGKSTDTLAAIKKILEAEQNICSYAKQVVEILGKNYGLPIGAKNECLKYLVTLYPALNHVEKVERNDESEAQALGNKVKL